MRKAILFQNGSIGDFLMWIYLAEQLHTSGRFSEICIVVPRNSTFLKGLIAEYPYLSVLEVSLKNPAAALSLFRGKKLALLYPTFGYLPLRVKLLAWSISRGKGSELIGFRDSGSLCSLYTKTLIYNIDKPYIETVRDLMELCGAARNTQPPQLKFKADEKALEQYGLRGQRYIVFHPGASNPRRLFKTEAAAEVVQHVLSSDPDIKIVLSGSQAELSLLQDIQNKVQDDRAIVVLGADVRELGSLIQFSQLFVGTDSGVTHLACFLNKPVLEVAHGGTKNWLAFYHSKARVLYRLINEEEVRSSEAYIYERVPAGIRKAFGDVPSRALQASLIEILHERNI